MPLPEPSRVLDTITLVLRRDWGRGAVTLPGQLMELDEMVGILDEISGARFVEDSDEPDPLGRRATRRGVWQLGSYVVFLCNLDGVLKKERERVAELLRAWFGIEAPELKAELVAQNSVLDHCREWRHKVFAHTSFAFPKKDGPLLQLNSLKFHAGTLVGFTKDGGVQLGGARLSHGSDDGPVLKPLSLAQATADARLCVEGRCELMARTIAPLLELPDRRIMELCNGGRVEEVLRVDAGAASPRSRTVRRELNPPI